MLDAVAEIRLTPTSYLVLGLVALAGRATPYDLKRTVASSVGLVWSFPHAQLYSEPARLTAAGLLHEQREKGGRNRRYFTVTAAGREALHRWLSQPPAESLELRDPGLLRLFFADLLNATELAALADRQREFHRERLGRLEDEASAAGGQLAKSARLGPLRMGLIYERAAVAFWQEVARDAARHTKRGKGGGV
jgi:PadR family transcriptional regulator AphA